MRYFYFSIPLMNYYVTKSVKSKNVAFLLVLFLGPFGLFYATVGGAFVMLILAPILLVTGDWAFLLFPIYYVFCFIWALSAVADYNRQIMRNSRNLAQGNNQNNSGSNDTNFQLSEQKKETYNDLERVKSLFDQKIITEESYNNQKDLLLKRLEIISHNQSPVSVASAPEVYRNNSSKSIQTSKRPGTWILAICLLLLISIGYIMFDSKSKSFKLERLNQLFSAHSKDEKEIKEQIEKTYFGLINGAYTANGIKGLGPEGLPFYNQNLQSLYVMGLTPFAQMFGGLKIEVNKIDVYNFLDENSAQVKYDILVKTSEGEKIVVIDMTVKRIGGYWKLDAEKALGFESEKKKQISKKIETTSDSQKISKKFLTNPSNKAMKVIRYCINKNELDCTYIEQSDNLYFIFYDKKIFMIREGTLYKLWHETKNYREDEYDITETKEGDIFTDFGGLSIDYKTGKHIKYDWESVGIKTVYIKDQFID